MQKTKPNAAAGKAKAHDSGKAGKYGKAGGQVSQAKAGNSGKARKPLTAEQRERKNRMDRERRKRIKQANQAKQAKQPKQPRQAGGSCGGCSCGRKHEGTETGVTAMSIAAMIGKHIGAQVAGQVAEQIARLLPGRDVVSMSDLEVIEPGVARGTVSFSNGARAVFTFVDRDAVDPLSAYSPLPAPVKAILLHHRVTQEVSDLVDAHIGMESEP